MAKLSPQELKQRFKLTVEAVWDTWGNYMDSRSKNPFVNPERIQETDIDNDLLRQWYSDVAYAQGIHDSTGWSLHDPKGPKEWSP